MNEAELMEAFREHGQMLDALLFGYVSLLTGFLVMSYLVSEKLSTMLTVLVLTLYTLSCGLLVTRITFLRNDFQALHSFILEQQAAGSINIPWFGTNPAWGGTIVTYLIWAVTIGGYLASILFYFYQRRAHRHDA